MSSHLEHLIRLAQKTGDTLIIHDKTGEDLVIMDVSKYEVLHDMFDEHHDGYANYDLMKDSDVDLSEMNEREMLDKINRDISIWRSHKEMEDFDYGEQDYFSEENVDTQPDWHKAGDVLEDRHSNLVNDEELESLDDDNIFSESEFEQDADEYNWDDSVFNEDVSLDLERTEEYDDLNSIENNVDVEYDQIGEASLGNVTDKKDIPFVEHNQIEEEGFTEEKLDDDEPIFFEEPV